MNADEVFSIIDDMGGDHIPRETVHDENEETKRVDTKEKEKEKEKVKEKVKEKAETPDNENQETPKPPEEEKVGITDGKDFSEIQCYFKKLNVKKPETNSDSKVPDDKDFVDSVGLFYCNKNNDITNKKCEMDKEICPKCLKKAQKLYGLKPHYLINSMGRVCTYKNKKMYCKGKFYRIENKNNIQYHIDYVCGHSGQCDSCRSLTQYMKGYFGDKLMNDLKKRDEALM